MLLRCTWYINHHIRRAPTNSKRKVDIVLVTSYIAIKEKQSAQHSRTAATE